MAQMVGLMDICNILDLNYDAAAGMGRGVKTLKKEKYYQISFGFHALISHRNLEFMFSFFASILIPGINLESAASLTSHILLIRRVVTFVPF